MGNVMKIGKNIIASMYAIILGSQTYAQSEIPEGTVLMCQRGAGRVPASIYIDPIYKRQAESFFFSRLEYAILFG